MRAHDLSILFVTNNYTPYRSGIVSSIDAFRQALNQCGHKVHIATLDFASHPADSPYVTRVPCPLKFTYRGNPMAVPWQAKRTLEQLIERLKPDLVHVHHPFLLGENSRQICHAQNLPLVFTHHSQYEQYAHYVPLMPPTLARPLIERMVTSFCNNAHAIIAPSESIKRILITRKVTRPIWVVPSPIRPLFANDIEACHLKKHNSLFKLLYVGRLVPEKDIPFIIDACAQLPQEQYSLILAGYGYYTDQLQSYAQKHGLAPKCMHIISNPSPADLAKLYQEADAFVFASPCDTQALVLAEAMAAGTPVIARHGPGQDDIVINGYNGFLVNDRPEMVNTLMAIAQNQRLHEELQRGARQTAQSFFPEQLVKKLLTVYETVIDNHF